MATIFVFSLGITKMTSTHHCSCSFWPLMVIKHQQSQHIFPASVVLAQWPPRYIYALHHADPDIRSII